MTESIQERIAAIQETLTRAERQLAEAILANYPVSGLGSITRLAEAADVSTPTVARMVQKLGYSGFPEFQDALRQELEARISNPIAKRDRWTDAAPDAHILNRFTDKATQNIRQTIAHLDPGAFDEAARLLADEARAISVTGGRITHAVSEYLYLHLQVIRPRVGHIRSTANSWPHDLLDMTAGDVVVIYDVRRYENATLRLAEMAERRGAEIILFTDQWQSPVARHASNVFSCRIEAPSAWDSGVATLLLTECLIAAVQEIRWDSTSDRMRRLEEIFDESRTFRKFV
ncbi:MurR/RpiR family transcriptional regulator [Ovoidimarina sediminis]|uniref:MurR/RpiR family transcriptional regulator n=1 Tax=Ovoidimarina sediminis TaxID=3079856 RepID=UPI002912D7A7|nr:MurR/RpiR family transcriptional regulator [Rhodophyticola sp. MJ-SS7]MDU8942036.1 MurR/RpiR family transcriptional regulator [Rhodophyticola sp. MJ-SS7]